MKAKLRAAKHGVFIVLLAAVMLVALIVFPEEMEKDPRSPKR